VDGKLGCSIPSCTVEICAVEQLQTVHTAFSEVQPVEMNLTINHDFSCCLLYDHFFVHKSTYDKSVIQKISHNKEH